MRNVSGGSEDPIARLVSHLHDVRVAHEGQPPRRRYAALARELELQLAELPAAERHAALRRALEAMRPHEPQVPAGEDPGAVSAFRAELERIRAEKAEGGEAAEALRAELESVRAARADEGKAASLLRAELDRARAETTREGEAASALRVELERLRAERAEEGETSVALRAELERIRADVTQEGEAIALRVELDRIRAEKVEAGRSVAALRAELEHLKSERGKEGDAAAALRAELERMRSERSKEGEAAAALRAEAERIRSERSKEGEAAAALRTELARIQTERSEEARSNTVVRAELQRVQTERAELGRERDTLLATRNDLLIEITKLREASHANAATAPVAAAMSSPAEAFRTGLKASLSGKPVDPESLGIAAGDVRLFRLTQELAQFVHMLERGRIAFLNQAEVGSAGAMGTQILKGAQDQVRKRILAVLNDEVGSIRKLRETMDEQNRFILGVPDAFQRAIPKGMATLLSKLDPDPMLARSKRIFTDYEKAWAEFVRTHSDLSNLTPEEVWETYFQEAFREKLNEWTKHKS